MQKRGAAFHGLMALWLVVFRVISFGVVGHPARLLLKPVLSDLFDAFAPVVFSARYKRLS